MDDFSERLVSLLDSYVAEIERAPVLVTKVASRPRRPRKKKQAPIPSADPEVEPPQDLSQEPIVEVLESVRSVEVPDTQELPEPPPKPVVRLPVIVEASPAPGDDSSLFLLHERPKTRGDCLPGGCNEQRPCPWVSCKYHLAIHGIYADGEPNMIADWDDGRPSCTLDLAEDEKNTTLEEIGLLLNVTRERVRQIELKGLSRLKTLVRKDRIDFEKPVEPVTYEETLR